MRKHFKFHSGPMPGDIFWYKNPLKKNQDEDTHLMCGNRPVLITKINEHNNTFAFLLLTSQEHENQIVLYPNEQPERVVMDNIRAEGIGNIHNVLYRYSGTIPKETLERLFEDFLKSLSGSYTYVDDPIYHCEAPKLLKGRLFKKFDTYYIITHVMDKEILALPLLPNPIGIDDIMVTSPSGKILYLNSITVHMFTVDDIKEEPFGGYLDECDVDELNFQLFLQNTYVTATNFRGVESLKKRVEKIEGESKENTELDQLRELILKTRKMVTDLSNRVDDLCKNQHRDPSPKEIMEKAILVKQELKKVELSKEVSKPIELPSPPKPVIVEPKKETTTVPTTTPYSNVSQSSHLTSKIPMQYNPFQNLGSMIAKKKMDEEMGIPPQLVREVTEDLHSRNSLMPNKVFADNGVEVCEWPTIHWFDYKGLHKKGLFYDKCHTEESLIVAYSYTESDFRKEYKNEKVANYKRFRKTLTERTKWNLAPDEAYKRAYANNYVITRK